VSENYRQKQKKVTESVFSVVSDSYVCLKKQAINRNDDKTSRYKCYTAAEKTARCSVLFEKCSYDIVWA